MIIPPEGLKFAYHCNKGTNYMYCGEMDNKFISFAWKLGLHPSILAHWSSITSNSTTWTTITGNGLVGALHVIEVDKVVLTLSTIYHVHPSHIAPVCFGCYFSYSTK
jgi:hypothetical protein